MLDEKLKHIIDRLKVIHVHEWRRSPSWCIRNVFAPHLRHNGFVLFEMIILAHCVGSGIALFYESNRFRFNIIYCDVLPWRQLTISTEP